MCGWLCHLSNPNLRFQRTDHQLAHTINGFFAAKESLIDLLSNRCLHFVFSGELPDSDTGIYALGDHAQSLDNIGQFLSISNSLADFSIAAVR